MSIIEKGRVRKYLLYAIGEIILVVLGILIAVQINSWKSESDDKEELIDNLYLLDYELTWNLYRLNLLNGHMESRFPRLDAAMDKDLDSIYPEWPAEMILEKPPMDMGNIAYQSVADKIDHMPERWNYLVITIQDLYVNNVRKIDGTYARLAENVLDNHTYLTENFSWYPHLNNRDTMQQYVFDLLNDFQFQNRLTLYRRLLADYDLAIRNQRREVLTLRMQLKKELDESIDVEENFNNHEYQSVVKLACDDLPAENGEESELGHCYIYMYNASDSPITPYWMGHEEEVRNQSINAGRMVLHKSFCGQRWKIRREDGTCTSFMIEHPQSYVVIE